MSHQGPLPILLLNHEAAVQLRCGKRSSDSRCAQPHGRWFIDEHGALRSLDRTEIRTNLAERIEAERLGTEPPSTGSPRWKFEENCRCKAKINLSFDSIGAMVRQAWESRASDWNISGPN